MVLEVRVGETQVQCLAVQQRKRISTSRYFVSHPLGGLAGVLDEELPQRATVRWTTIETESHDRMLNAGARL
jgi:hypothetical protein